MDYLDKIKLVTNYKELNGPTNNDVMFIPYVYFPSDNQLKSLKRDYLINEILDNKQKSTTSTKYSDWGLGEFEEGVIAPKVMSVSVKSQIKTEKIVWDDLISKFNNITKKTYSNSFRSNYDLTTSTKDTETILKEIFLKINMLSSHIAMESRIGPAKTLIVSKDLEYITNINDNIKNIGLNIIIEENINPKTIIVLRNGLSDTEGIIVIREGDNWWEHSTENWLKNISWFKVI